MPIGMGEFLENSTSGNCHPAVSRDEAKYTAQAYFSMLTLLKRRAFLAPDARPARDALALPSPALFAACAAAGAAAFRRPPRPAAVRWRC